MFLRAIVMIMLVLLAIGIGYFFSIYSVLALTALLCFIYVREVFRPNPYPGTSGKLGGMIMGLIVLVPFTMSMLITSLIINRSKVVEFFKTIAYYFSIVFLR